MKVYSEVCSTVLNGTFTLVSVIRTAVWKQEN